MAAPRQGVHQQGNEELTYGDAGTTEEGIINRTGVQGASNRPEDEEEGFYKGGEKGAVEPAGDTNQFTGSNAGGGLAPGGNISSSKDH